MGKSAHSLGTMAGRVEHRLGFSNPLGIDEVRWRVPSRGLIFVEQ
jgi:hypothetical protein